MKTRFVSSKNSILDFIQDVDFDGQQGEIDEPLLMKWATDCLRWINTEEQLHHRIGILQIKNSRVKLPDDFKLLAQVAAHPWHHGPCDHCTKHHDDHPHHEHGHHGHQHHDHHHHCTRREQLVSWVQGTFEKDCQLEINLICPTCHETKCECGGPVIEVDVDRIWEMAHPENYYRHFTKIGRFGHGPGHNSFYSPKFELMRYATNDYFNLSHVLTNCPNVGCKNFFNEFIIDLPYIEVDFEEGEILISYLGTVLDDDGELMMPDHSDVFEAVTQHLIHKWYNRIWLRKSDKAARIKSQEARAFREEAIGMANSALNIPDFAQFRSWMDNNYYKRIPNFSHHEDMNNLTPDEYEKYSRVLDGHHHHHGRHHGHGHHGGRKF